VWRESGGWCENSNLPKYLVICLRLVLSGQCRCKNCSVHELMETRRGCQLTAPPDIVNTCVTCWFPCCLVSSRIRVHGSLRHRMTCFTLNHALLVIGSWIHTELTYGICEVGLFSEMAYMLLPSMRYTISRFGLAGGCIDLQFAMPYRCGTSSIYCLPRFNRIVLAFLSRLTSIPTRNFFISPRSIMSAACDHLNSSEWRKE
jgi:hypothetical protein